MEEFAEYILNEEDLIAKEEIIYFLAPKLGINFDKATTSLIPYTVTIFLAISVATSISLLAPVEISSNTSFSAALPPSNAINFSCISVLDI